MDNMRAINARSEGSVATGLNAQADNSSLNSAAAYVCFSNIPLFLMIIIVLSEIFSVPMKYSA